MLTRKNIFLDIACFFNGQNKENPNYIWEGCGYYPQSGLAVLIKKSLVKIDDNNKFRMHDQLRDMGRQIAYEENCKEPGKRSRLWSAEDILDVLNEHKVRARSMYLLSLFYITIKS